MPDEDLQRLFKEGRVADHDAAPSFGETIAASKQKTQSAAPFLAVALAAAVVLAGFWLWPSGDEPSIGPIPQVAETNPLPDLPEQAEESIDDELELFALWEPAGSSPTDFLLEEQGLLGEVLVPSELDELVLESEDLLMEL